jgi:hypothetical protein
MDNYEKHPMYGRFMAEVISGHYRNDRTSFDDFLEKINESNTKSLQNKFQYSAIQINKFVKFTPVTATWYENGKVTFEVKLNKAEAVEKEDGWHLLGFDSEGKEHCIGGAVITCSQILYKP